MTEVMNEEPTFQFTSNKKVCLKTTLNKFTSIEMGLSREIV